MSYILAPDQGTTSSRALVLDEMGQVVGQAQREFRQYFPSPGRVEHDPEEIWESQVGTAHGAIAQAGIRAADLSAIGITNQRETTVVWDRTTGRAIGNAIVWQDRRTAGFCDRMKEAGLEPLFRERTGLVLDPYFSGTKVRWMLDNVDGARALADAGRLAFGTVDSWLIWRLTGGAVHATDPSNASRTLLFNIHTLAWDDELLAALDVPRSMLPEVRDSSGDFGRTAPGVFDAPVRIAGVAGDQQAALFGQLCLEPGMVKNTYGTGCFALMNAGGVPVTSENNLLTTVAWSIGGKTTYALEGSVFVGGAVVQWLRDGLGILSASADVERLAAQVDDAGGVVFVPAFTGLGAPHWDAYARGGVLGITRGTTQAHIARAALESIAFQSVDLIRAMEADSGVPVRELRVDGGATANDLLMQMQADFLRAPVIRPHMLETTALGAAYLAGLVSGAWASVGELAEQWQIDRRFTPGMPALEVATRMRRWTRAIDRVRRWDAEDCPPAHLQPGDSHDPFLGELVGTALLVLLGDGVVANVVLARTKGQGSGWIVITMGWGLAVFVGVFVVASASGAHLNPAVTVALSMAGKFAWADVPLYVAAQMLGAMFGASLVWLHYRMHFGATDDLDAKLGVFSSMPAIRNTVANFVSEAVGTFVLVFGVLNLASAEVGLGALDALPVALLVLAIGLSLGGTTGYAINPARDLSPRIVHALLPIPGGKRDSDWGYAWIPVVGPLVGGAVAAVVYGVLVG